MKHPYQSLAEVHFWRSQVSDVGTPWDVAYDPAPKFRFDLEKDRFATAGSCFAQHLGNRLADAGGTLLMAESRHPLEPEHARHGYGVFSARYGNIYTTRQLRELLDQTLGIRSPIVELARREDGRWIDMLRPRAIPEGFESSQQATQDRLRHLACVKRLWEQASVFVFTLGLTESSRQSSMYLKT
jgi:hypothetical protein